MKKAKKKHCKEAGMKMSMGRGERGDTESYTDKKMTVEDCVEIDC